MENSTTENKLNAVFTPEELLNHWQSHRALTRRTIVAFPEKDFFNHTIGGMRPYSKMVQEMLAIAGPGIKEIVDGKKAEFIENDYGNKKENYLKAWDEATEIINTYFPKIELEDFHRPVKTFGQYEGTVISSILYFLENEIHHRGQGYVYLRSLNIEPPFFWEH